jgi:hypothetical protein
VPNSRNIDENQPLRYGDLELEWEVNGGSGVPKSMSIKKNSSCSSQDSLIKCNAGLDDGDDLVRKNLNYYIIDPNTLFWIFFFSFCSFVIGQN